MKRAETIQEYHDQAKACLNCVDQFWMRCQIGEVGAESIGVILEVLAEILKTEPDQEAEGRLAVADSARRNGTSPHRLGGKVGRSVHDATFRFGVAVIQAVRLGYAQMEEPPQEQDPASWTGENVEALRVYIEHDLAEAIRIDPGEIAETRIMLENEFATLLSQQNGVDSPTGSGGKKNRKRGGGKPQKWAELRDVITKHPDADNGKIVSLFRQQHSNHPHRDEVDESKVAGVRKEMNRKPRKRQSK